MQFCKEPASEKLTKKDDFFAIDVSETHDSTILTIFQQNKVVDKFFISKIDKAFLPKTKEMCNKFTVIRLRKQSSN
jgi:hypothetical protein